MTLKKDFIRGVKLSVVLFLGSLFVIIPRILIPLKVGNLVIALIIFLSIIMNGHLIKKYKRWIFK